jgi:hypothetical protein
MKLRLIPLFSITSIVILMIAMSARQRTDAQQPPVPLPPPESTADPLPVDREKYSPTHYGIPETLAGFEVVAVVSHETNPCSPSDYMEVIIQATEPSLDEYLRGNMPQSIVTAMEALQSIYPTGFISVVGPIEDKDGFFVQLEQNYLELQQTITRGGCLSFGRASSSDKDEE